MDAKGRMNIPSDLRRVLVDGDPDCPASGTPRIVILFGPHLQDHLQAYTISDMQKIEAGIRKLPRGSKQRKKASRDILGKSWETEIDKDGRVVLPKALRDQIGLTGQAVLTGLGEYFEIWDKARFDAMEVDEAEDDDWGEDFDPMTLIPDVDDL